MTKWLPLAVALGAASLLSSACALPKGSFARPVTPAGDGAIMMSGGVMVPFAAVGGATSGDFGSATVDEAFIIPAVAFDYSFDERHYFGVDVSVWSAAFSTVDTTGDDFVGVFVNPRWEYAVLENFSITVDGNFGFLSVDSGGDINGAPFFSPTFGIRFYLPTGFGGVVMTQQIGTAFITITLPGSMAYDIPIPVGDEVVLHIFPELRWDPTFFFVGDNGGGFSFFSGGLSFMLEV